MKECCVVFDTNILDENKTKLIDIKKKLSDSADIYIPRIVIEEIQAQKSRTITDDYKKINGIIDKNKDIFNYEEKFKLSSILKDSEKNIEKWLKHYCNENIIEYSDITIEDILVRLKYKEAPFINEKNSSDKGFKDTILWLSILKNTELQKYKKIILVTQDKAGFVKRTDEIIEEYNKVNKNLIVIFSNINELYDNLNIIESTKSEIDSNSSKLEKIEIESVDEIKEKLNTCIDKLLYVIYEDEWEINHYDMRFSIYDKMNDEDVECLLSSLDSFLKENIFFKEIDIEELLTRCGIESAGDFVPSEYLNQLNSIYLDLKDKEELYRPFIKFVKDKFNKIYVARTRSKKAYLDDIDTDDLPF